MKLVLSILLLFSFTGISYGQEAGVMLARATYLEEVEGNLQAAIETYDQVVSQFADERPVAAKAILRSGMAHEKLGAEQAQEYYHLLLKNYPEQEELVAIARKRLARFASTPPTETLVYRKLADLKDVYGSISPNGRYISYVDWEEANLMMHDVKTGKSSPITSDGQWNTPAQYPDMSVWSPDNQSIAYLWIAGDGKSELRVTNVATGDTETITDTRKDDFYWPYQWTAGGGILAEVIMKPHDLLRLVLIDPETKRVEIVRELGDLPDNVKIHGASVSPDGKYLALTETRNDQSEIAIYSTSAPRSNELSRFNNVKGRAIWSADGQSVYYASDKNQTSALYQRPIDNGMADPVDNVILENLADSFTPSVINPVTGDLYFTSNYNENSLSEVVLDWENQSFETPRILETSNRRLWSPAVSPDGLKIAYCQGLPVTGHGALLGIRNVMNDQFVEFEFDSLHIELPQKNAKLEWTPDGTHVVAMFNQYDGKGNKLHGLVYIDHRNGSFKKYELNAESLTKVLLSSKDIIYFDKATNQIKRRNLDSLEEYILADMNGGQILAMSLSHSRDKVAMFVTNNQVNELVLLDLASREMRSIWSIPQDSYFIDHHAPIWAPSDNVLLSATREGDWVQFYVSNMLDLKSNKFGKTMNASDNLWSYTNPSADAAMLRFVRAQVRSSAWSVENMK